MSAVKPQDPSKIIGSDWHPVVTVIRPLSTISGAGR